MRVLVQRVTSASVSVDGEVVGAIDAAEQGLLALVGITHSDDADLARRMARNSGSYGFSTASYLPPTSGRRYW